MYGSYLTSPFRENRNYGFTNASFMIGSSNEGGHLFMKGKVKIILSLTAVLVLAGGLFALSLLNSPEYALIMLVEDVTKNGLASLDAHMTGTAKETWNKVNRLIGHPLTGLLANQLGLLQKAEQVSESLDMNVTLGKVVRDMDEATVTLQLNGKGFDGPVDLYMVWQNGQWLISDVSFPFMDWLM